MLNPSGGYISSSHSLTMKAIPRRLTGEVAGRHQYPDRSLHSVAASHHITSRGIFLSDQGTRPAHEAAEYSRCALLQYE